MGGGGVRFVGRSAPLLRWLLALALMQGLVACVPSGAATDAQSEGSPTQDSGEAPLRKPTVVLISLDGTRPADLTPERLPSLVAVARQGAIAKGLTPVDPTNTFPNHVSLATGVRPEVHRLVNNSFVDPERGRFKRQDPNTWIASEPIWSVAERNGLRTASFFWVGSEGPWEGGPGPTETRVFSSRTPEKTKVNQILEWLSLEDEEKRPRLIVAWFHGADHAAHEEGPEDEEVTRYLAPQDVQIARLVREMGSRGLFETTTLIFVSDHGMVEADTRINLSKRLKQANLAVSVLGVGGFSSIVFDKNKKSAAGVKQAVAIAREAGLEAWPQAEAPDDWHMNDPRFGDVVVHAPIGTAIVTATTRIEGFHGYQAHERAMSGMLVARGRGVMPGTELGRVSGLAVAPTVLRLLGLPVPSQMKEAPIPGLLQGIAPAVETEEAGQ